MSAFDSINLKYPRYVSLLSAREDKYVGKLNTVVYACSMLLSEVAWADFILVYLGSKDHCLVLLIYADIYCKITVLIHYT